MIIKTDHGTIMSDIEGFYLKSENVKGKEITLGDWDREENYIEISEEEYNKIIEQEETLEN